MSKVAVYITSKKEPIQKWITKNWIDIILVIAAIVLGLILWAAYLSIFKGYGWADWVGFSGYHGSLPEDQRAKTLWDWMELLIIPVVLAIGGLIFSWMQKQTEIRVSEERAKTEREIADDRQKENALQAYLDKMTRLLLENGLRASAENSEVRAVANARTLSTLRALDGERKGTLIRFLIDAGLLGEEHNIMPVRVRGFIVGSVEYEVSHTTHRNTLSRTHVNIINLEGASLEGANLVKANLSGACLKEAKLGNALLVLANLIGADLKGANLERANLEGAYLDRAKLQFANLKGAILERANLEEARLSGAFLGGATLENANMKGINLEAATLRGANLERVNLDAAELEYANLEGATLKCADMKGINLEAATLEGANLEGANLKGAKGTTPEQLEQAKTLKGVTMPDGTIHE